MATALARIFEDDHGLETLIICPKNLVPMWEDYVARSTGCAPRCCRSAGSISELPELRRYRLVLIDESHNLRNREGKRYRAIQEYIAAQREQRASCSRPRPTTRPTSTCRTSCGCSSPRTRTSGSGPRAAAARARRDRVHPPAPVPCPLAGRLREERICRRLARADAAVPGAPHPQFHPGQLRRDRPGNGRKYLTFDGRHALLLPRRACPKTVQFAIDDKDPDDQYARLYADAGGGRDQRA